MLILGIDPGLRCTGWGVIAVDGGRLQHIANGSIRPKSTLDDASRLQIIFDGLDEKGGVQNVSSDFGSSDYVIPKLA